MALELSNLIFTEQDDIVPASGVEQILNTGVANILAGNDRITGSGSDYGLRNDGTINTDDGNDTITGMGEPSPISPNDNVGFYNTGTLNAGEGNDIITGSAFWGGFYNIGTLNAGEGNDTIIGDGAYGSGIASSAGSIFDTGDGNDLIRASSGRGGFYNSSNNFTTGDGNDTIHGGSSDYPGIVNEGLINTGNGEDYLISEGPLLNYGGMFLGDGNDWLYTTEYVGLTNRTLENLNFIGTGDGNDIISSIGVIYNEGVINTGDGADSIIANGGFQSGSNSSGSVFLEDGADYIKGFGSGDFYGGNGNDTLELTTGTYTVGIWGEGGESPIFTKGNQLMITSEFEKLIAGNTLYDFTSLTAGQIITVA
jgi:hypothetical protein